MTGTVEFEGSLVPPLSGVKGNEAAYTILVPPKTSFFLNYGQVCKFIDLQSSLK